MYDSLLKCAKIYTEAAWRGRKDRRYQYYNPYDFYGQTKEEPWWSQLLTEKRYWGKKASGMLFVCKEDGTILLLKRSMKVEDPGDWGIPGGAIGEGFYSKEHKEKDPDNETFLNSAVKETWEELGAVPKVGTLLSTTSYRDADFTYNTYIYDIPLYEKERFSKQIKLNWENDYWFWFSYDKLPANLHKGVIFAIKEWIKEPEDSEDPEEQEESVEPTEAEG